METESTACARCSNIPRAVHYCLRDFRDCPIYQRFMEIDDF
jgi:hypothetical protein